MTSIPRTFPIVVRGASLIAIPAVVALRASFGIADVPCGRPVTLAVGHDGGAAFSLVPPVMLNFRACSASRREI